MKKENNTNAGTAAETRKIPSREADKEFRWRLRELDWVDSESLNEQFWDNSTNQIMARIEKTEIQKPSSVSAHSTASLPEYLKLYRPSL